MYRGLLKLSRAFLHWPPEPASISTKHGRIRDFAERTGVSNFVETGTFRGEMVEAQREYFSKVITIELSKELYEGALHRFKNYSNVYPLQGDSGIMLTKAIDMIDGPAIFWLDAHYSKGVTARGDEETPILKELSLIAKRHEPRDIVLIDDARLFTYHPGYPSLAKIRNFAKHAWRDHSFFVESDAIHIIPSILSRS